MSASFEVNWMTSSLSAVRIGAFYKVAGIKIIIESLNIKLSCTIIGRGSFPAITFQWLFDFKQFDWVGGHRLSAHILVIDYIWKTPETKVIFELAASSDTIYFQINICR